MKYTKEDILIGSSFKRNPKDKSRLVCVAKTDNNIYFHDSQNNNWTSDYSIGTVLNHINTSLDIDFQKYSHYEIY